MLREDIKEFIKTIPTNVTLVAATKYIDSNGIKELYNVGIKDYGENRVDAFLAKYEALSSYQDIRWHFIGHLQRNKAKLIINKIDYLHSLDSLELAELINKLRDKPLDTFIEVSINLEESKNGVPYYDALEFISKVKEYPHINIIGLMMMAEKGSLDTEEQFHKLRLLRDEIESKLNISLPYLSMGMSEDYQAAIKEGATHIRLGRILYK